jgi:hypothetical protein
MMRIIKVNIKRLTHHGIGRREGVENVNKGQQLRKSTTLGLPRASMLNGVVRAITKSISKILFRAP